MSCTLLTLAQMPKRMKQPKASTPCTRHYAPRRHSPSAPGRPPDGRSPAASHDRTPPIFAPTFCLASITGRRLKMRGRGMCVRRRFAPTFKLFFIRRFGNRRNPRAPLRLDAGGRGGPPPQGQGEAETTYLKSRTGMPDANQTLTQSQCTHTQRGSPAWQLPLFRSARTSMMAMRAWPASAPPAPGRPHRLDSIANARRTNTEGRGGAQPGPARPGPARTAARALRLGAAAAPRQRPPRADPLVA